MPLNSTTARLALLAAWALALPALAEVPKDFLGRYEAEARASDSAFAPSAPRGERFFKTVGSKDWSCSSCHTDNPAAMGKHAVTGKPIEPLAPASNGQRFTKADKVEKWFKRNCNDVIGRTCSAGEKADVLAYLIAIGK